MLTWEKRKSNLKVQLTATYITLKSYLISKVFLSYMCICINFYLVTCMSFETIETEV